MNVNDKLFFICRQIDNNNNNYNVLFCFCNRVSLNKGQACQRLLRIIRTVVNIKERLGCAFLLRA